MRTIKKTIAEFFGAIFIVFAIVAVFAFLITMVTIPIALISADLEGLRNSFVVCIFSFIYLFVIDGYIED